jgi:hypothetical protein
LAAVATERELESAVSQAAVLHHRILHPRIPVPLNRSRHSGGPTPKPVASQRPSASRTSRQA